MDAVLDFLVAALIGGVLTLGASLTGQNERLCDMLGGTHQADATGGAEQCPDGKWSNIPLPKPKE